MGFAAARRLLRRGLAVGLTGRREDRLVKAQAALLSEIPSGLVHIHAADAGDFDQAATSVASLAALVGAPDVFVDCAGIFEPVDVLDLDESSWAATMNTTLNSCLYPTVAAARLMKAREKGRIVLIGSTSAVLSEPGTAAYCAAKAAIHSLVRSLCVDLSRFGIQANAVAPGWVHTELNDEFVSNADPAALATINPLGRVGLPDEIANVIEYLGLDAPDYLTGATIVVDGGQTGYAPLL
jgi:NAD(P)-dependent dehydrogenase (short-subunit alcohol dehydrogenase family)